MSLVALVHYAYPYPVVFIFHHISSFPYLSPYLQFSLHFAMSPVVLFSRYPYVLSLFCISPFSCSSFVHNVYFCSIYRYLVVLIHHNVSTCPYLSPIQALISFAFFMYVSTIVFYRTAFNLFSHMSFLPPSFMATPASSFYLLLLISRHPDILYSISVHPYLSVYLQKISQSPESILT